MLYKHHSCGGLSEWKEERNDIDELDEGLFRRMTRELSGSEGFSVTEKKNKALALVEAYILSTSRGGAFSKKCYLPAP